MRGVRPVSRVLRCPRDAAPRFGDEPGRGVWTWCSEWSQGLWAPLRVAGGLGVQSNGPRG